MKKFAVRDADPDGEWDNGTVAFVHAPTEDLAKEEVSKRRDTKRMSLVAEDVSEVPTYNWTGRGR